MSRPTLSVPSRKPSLPGACSGMPDGYQRIVRRQMTGRRPRRASRPGPGDTADQFISGRTEVCGSATAASPSSRPAACDGTAMAISSPAVRCRPPGAGCPGVPSSRTSSWLLAAGVDRNRAARVERAAASAATAGWRVRLAARRDSRPSPGSSRPAPGCRGAAGRLMTSSAGPISTMRPEVHHRDPVGDHPGDRQVVGDEQDRHAQLAAQAADEVEHGCGQRHVQRAGRLVAQQHRRRHDRRPGQRDPLALTAGQLTRPWLRRPRRAARRARAPPRPASALARGTSSRSSRSRSPTARRPTATASATRPRPGTPSAAGPPARADRPAASGAPGPAIDPQQRRLAGSALADQRHRLAVADRQSNAAQRLQFAAALADDRRAARRHGERLGDVTAGDRLGDSVEPAPSDVGSGRVVRRASTRAGGWSATSSNGRMHALTRPGWRPADRRRRRRRRSRSCGSTQRGANAHPGSGSRGRAARPGSAASWRSPCACPG